jgi:hypothetical protein
MYARATPPVKGGMGPCWCCGRRHHCWHNLARCIWKRAAWISGNPGGATCFALVSVCPVAPTVSLYASRDEAGRWKEFLDEGGCGHRCRGAVGHRVINLAEGELP